MSLHIGNGVCELKYNLTDCEGDITGGCNCSDVEASEENRYNGTFCDCCIEGPCNTHCFNRYAASNTEEEDMCSESGVCSCDGTGDVQQKHGEKCKVKAQLKFLASSKGHNKRML